MGPCAHCRRAPSCSQRRRIKHRKSILEGRGYEVSDSTSSKDRASTAQEPGASPPPDSAPYSFHSGASQSGHEQATPKFYKIENS